MDQEHYDTEAFFAALDGARETRGKTWKEVAAESGVSASTLTRMAQGKRPDIDGLAALAKWSGLDLNEYVKGKKAPRKKQETLAVISTYLRADPNLKKESADALEQIIRVAYRQFTEKA